MSSRNGMSKEQWAEYMRWWRAQKKAQLVANLAQFTHGTLNGYSNFGCRCDRCTDASRSRRKEWLENGGRQSPGTRAGRARRNRSYRQPPEESAPNRRKQWTGAEMDIATERDVNGNYVRGLIDVATMLGRSRVAVEHIRRACLNEPKYRRVIETMDV